MDIICSICQCSVASDPPDGSTELADLYDSFQPFCDKRSGPIQEELWASGKKIVTTLCGHIFHNSCLTQWFIMIGNRRCPLCNFISPVNKILSIYPCITIGSTHQDPTLENECLSSNTVAETVVKLDEEEPLQTVENDTSVIIRDLASETVEQEEPGEKAELQATETTLNGIRTMIYHFGGSGAALPPAIETASKCLNCLLSQKHSKVPGCVKRLTRTGLAAGGSSAEAVRQPQWFPGSPLKLTQCSRCNNLSRIQALMTRDIQDLRELIAEQNSEIDTLKGKLDSLENEQDPLSIAE